MKLLNNYLVYCFALALIFTGCSKDETSNGTDPSNPSESATITFGAVLNDLANRAMTKAHFDQIPTCSDGEPATAVIGLDYGDGEKEVVVDILQDEEGFFTAYSEDLKIPVPSNGTTTVTVTSFMVYDGDTSDAIDDMYFSEEYGNLIWIAPKSTNGDDAQFAGYVDNPLPYSFELSPGTKPYINIDVLCFDRRMVNEYGYVFFDIDQKEIFNFCLFGNFCTPSGRHFVANYSVDVWVGNDDSGIQIYDDLTSTAVDSNDDGIYEESPLCVALPDDPDMDNEEYYFEITLLDSPEYDAGDDEGRVVRSGILTEQEAKNLFVGDSMLEYYHFQVGNCGEEDNPPIFNDPEDVAMNYKSCLSELNDSGAIVFAYAKIEGNMLTTRVYANDVEKNMHAQHIHGFDGMAATCPDISQDLVENGGDGDNLLEIGEGASAYGAPQLFLTTSGATDGSSNGPWPVGDSSNMYVYTRTITLGADGNPSKSTITPLTDKVIVVHGLTVDGGYIGSLPIACGKFTANN